MLSKRLFLLSFLMVLSLSAKTGAKKSLVASNLSCLTKNCEFRDGRGNTIRIEAKNVKRAMELYSKVQQVIARVPAGQVVPPISWKNNGEVITVTPSSERGLVSRQEVEEDLNTTR